MAGKQESSQFSRVSEIFALSLLAVLMGFAGGAAAFALYHLIGFFTPATPVPWPWSAWSPGRSAICP